MSNIIKATFDFNQQTEQAGFRKGYATMDDVYVINRALEESAEQNQPLSVAFVDYERTFDSVEILAVMKALRNRGVQEVYVNTSGNIYRFHSYFASRQEK